MRADRCLRSPDGKGQERKKCWLRGGNGKVEGEHLTKAGSAVPSAVLLPPERACGSRGCAEGSVTRPGPQPAEAPESFRGAAAGRTSCTSYFRGLAASQEPLLYHFSSVGSRWPGCQARRGRIFLWSRALWGVSGEPHGGRAALKGSPHPEPTGPGPQNLGSLQTPPRGSWACGLRRLLGTS